MELTRVVIASAFCVLGVGGTPIARAEAPILVGVLEDVEPGNLSRGMSSPHVRIAFQYQNGTWTSLDEEYPEAVNWTVVLDGRQIGAIASRQKSHRAYLGGDIGIQDIATERAAVPRISTGAADFQYSGNKARTRPLLLVSGSYFKDPDAWKPTILSSAERRIAVQNFRARIPSLEQCDQPEQHPIHLVQYSDDEVVFIKAYRSETGAVLFGQRLSDRRSNCGFFDDPVFFDYWFAMKGTTIRFLDTQMTPLEAADVDGTGSSEWIFQTSRGEDEDGYELFYDDFSKKASFSWTYH